MEHLTAFLSTPATGQIVSSSTTNRSRRLQGTLSAVAQSLRLNFVDTLARKANKRATSSSPLPSTPLPKRCQSMVALPTTSIFSPNHQRFQVSLYNRPPRAPMKHFKRCSMATLHLPLRFLLHPHLQRGNLVFAVSLSLTYCN
jgi:hypothetical protein